MTPPVILGMVGRKRSGKDSFASRLVEHHGFVRYAFADALKATMYDLDPVIVVQQDEGFLFPPPHVHGTFTRRLRAVVDEIGWERAKEIREVRRLLQTHGVAIRTHVNPDVWLDAVIRPALAQDQPVVVTDVRFPNEADAVEVAGGSLVRVRRPGLDTSDAHVSETALDHRTTRFAVYNGGTLDDLAAEADRIVAEVL